MAKPWEQYQQQTGPWTQYQQPTQTAAEVSEIPQRQGMDAAAQYAGLVNRAVAPYATAAGVGAALGAPFGAVGAIPGAAAATGMLGAYDIGSSLFNVASGAFGGPQVMTGSEAIRALYPQGIFRQPETAGQAIGTTALESAVGGAGTANALRRLAPMISPNAMVRGVNVRQATEALGAQPAAQAATGAGAGATQQAITEYADPESPIRSPFLTPLLGVLGGTITGMGVIRGPQALREVTGRGTPSTERTYAAAKASYKDVDKSGVQFSADAVNSFLDELKLKLKQEGYTENQSSVTAQLNKLERLRNQPLSISQLDTVRSQVFKDLVNTASKDENVPRLGREIADSINDFVLDAPDSALISGTEKRPEAISKLLNARQLWAAVSKSEQMEELIRKARLEDKPLDEALRDEFRTLAKNQKKFNRFSADEQDFIINVVKGGPVAKALTDFSQALKVRQGLGGIVYGGLGGLSIPMIGNQFGAGVDFPTALGIGTLVAGGRKGAEMTANMMAAQRANQAAAAMRGFRRASLTPLTIPLLQTTGRQPIDFAAQSQALNALAQ